MRAGIIATVIVAVVAWLVDGFVYSMVLLPSQEFLDFMEPVMHSEESRPGPIMWIFYELPRAGVLAFALLQRPLSMGQSSMYGAVVFFMLWTVANIPMMMWMNAPADMMMILGDAVVAAILGAICGALMTFLFNKLGGAS